MYSGENGMRELRNLQSNEGDECHEQLMSCKYCEDLKRFLLEDAGEYGYLYVPEKLEDFYDSDQFNCLT